LKLQRLPISIEAPKVRELFAIASELGVVAPRPRAAQHEPFTLPLKIMCTATWVLGAASTGQASPWPAVLVFTSSMRRASRWSVRKDVKCRVKQQAN